MNNAALFKTQRVAERWAQSATRQRRVRLFETARV